MKTTLFFLLGLLLGHSSGFGQSSIEAEPLNGAERVKWFVVGTVGPESLAAGAFTAAFGTAINKPREYGPSWPGYGKRYAMRFTGIATSNAMEAGLGNLWGEDPRYFRSGSSSFKGRLGNVFAFTVSTRRRDGSLAPAFARYAAISGSNFLSNTWRADSEATTHDAVLRTLLGFAGRAGGNAFAEFWPDIRRHIFPRKSQRY